jgi:hypothetical protein
MEENGDDQGGPINPNVAIPMAQNDDKRIVATVMKT